MLRISRDSLLTSQEIRSAVWVKEGFVGVLDSVCGPGCPRLYRVVKHILSLDPEL